MYRVATAIVLLLPLTAAAGAPAHSVGVRVDDAESAQSVEIQLRQSRSLPRTAVDAYGSEFVDRTLRDSLNAAWRKRLEQWQVDAGLRVERRRGAGVEGGTFGSTGGNVRAAVLQAPLDQEMREWRFNATWNGGHQMFRMEGLLSSFENGHQALRWDNPFPAVAGWVPGAEAGSGALASAPDNRAHDFVVAWALSRPGGIRLDLDLGIGQHLQNDRFLPYTQNPVLVVGRGLPRPSLDGRVDRQRLQARIRIPATPTTELDLRWRDERNDDRTEPALFLYPAGDVAHQPTTLASGYARWRLPRDYRRQRFDAGWQWRAARRDRVRFEYARDATERAYAEVAETLEHRFAAEWRRTGARNAHLRAERATRDSGAYRDNLPWLAYHTDEYIATVAPEMRFENHPLLRRFNLADRTRTQLRGGFGWSGDAWHAGLTGSVRDDDYQDSVFGLTDSRQAGVNADLGYAVSDAQHLSAWVSRERWESRQDGRHFRGGMFFTADVGNADRNWRAATEDRVTATGIGWRHRAPWANGSVGIDISRAKSTVDVAVTAGTAIATAPLPAVTSTVDRVSLSVAHQVNARLSIRAALDHERWQSRDWATDGVTPTTMNGILGLTEQFPDWNFSWASFSVDWRF